MVKEKITSAKENCGHRHSTCKWPGVYFESCLLCKKRDDSGKLDSNLLLDLGGRKVKRPQFQLGLFLICPFKHTFTYSGYSVSGTRGGVDGK